MQANQLELLQRMPIFGALRDDALEFLLARTRRVEVHAGAFFFREGDSADCMYVLEAGRIEIFRDWCGQEVPLRQLALGDCFGEMALMDLAPRSASVRALEPCVAIELSTAHLHSLFKHDAEQFALIQMNIGREVCRRLRATDNLLFRYRMGDVPKGPGGLAEP